MSAILIVSGAFIFFTRDYRQEVTAMAFPPRQFFQSAEAYSAPREQRAFEDGLRV